MRSQKLLLIVLASVPTLAAAGPASCPLGNPGNRREWQSASSSAPILLSKGRVRVLSADTLYCSGCHDASVAPPGSSRTEHAVGVEFASGHPVDVPYPDFDRAFVPAAALDGRLALEGGRVTCRTCHGGTDAATRFLSITDRELCRACHRM